MIFWEPKICAIRGPPVLLSQCLCPFSVSAVAQVDQNTSFMVDDYGKEYNLGPWAKKFHLREPISRQMKY